MFRFLKKIVGVGLLLTLMGCDLFPQRDEAANAAIYQNILTKLNQLEVEGILDPNADGTLNPDTISFVFVHRYGTSFGGSQLLEGEDQAGTPLSAEDMVLLCREETQSVHVADIRPCLRSNFSTDNQLRYSHAGIAYKIPGGTWYVRQSLRSADTGVHFQWFGTLEDFVDIPLVETRIEVLVPTIDMQGKLAQALFGEKAGDFLIDPDYNLVAKPFQDQEQMSNQYVLEIAGAALRPAGTPLTRAGVQGYLESQGFHGDVILLGGIRSLAKWDRLVPTVDLSQQPYVREYEVGEIITVRSVRNFLVRNGHISQQFEVTD